MEVIAEYLPVDHRYQLGILDISLLLSVVEEYGLDADSLLNHSGLSDIDWHSQESHISYSDKLFAVPLCTEVFPQYWSRLVAWRAGDIEPFWYSRLRGFE